MPIVLRRSRSRRSGKAGTWSFQGPPGTGKSQTITNLIATAVKAGKKVLFVAEKMAALEVVHSRLERLGLGSLCLELHSSKSNKKLVLDEIARTIALGRPKFQGSEERIEALQSAIDRLNRHAEVMNTAIEPAGITPFQVIGRLAHLYGQGIDASNFDLPAPETWSGADFREHSRGLTDLQIHIKDMEPLSDHPWKGVGRTEPLLPTDVKELRGWIVEAVEALTGVQQKFTTLVQSLSETRAASFCLQDLKQIAQLARRVAEAPVMDRRAIGSLVWATRHQEIDALVVRGKANAERLGKLHGIVADVAWSTDLSATRQALATHGRSLFRWFRKDYRQSLASLRGIVKSPLPTTLEKRLELVDKVIAIQADLNALDHDPTLAQLGRDAFGDAWTGSKSDWDALARIVRWDLDCRGSKVAWDHRDLVSRLEEPERLKDSSQALAASLPPALGRLRELAKFLILETSQAFGVDSLIAVPIDDFVERLGRWRQNSESLSKWIGYRMRRRRLDEAGLGAIIAGIEDGRITPSTAVDQFQAAYYQTLIRTIFRNHRDLAEFDGQTHDQWIEDFRRLDQARIEMARSEVATAHYDAIPRHAAVGDMAVLRREFEKKRRHKPIRQIIREAGTGLLAVKPVFLMSPISVAQFLEPGSVTFDLLLIDEASQISPVDALGAMARAGQVVVVGDDKQLPPTRFFSKMLDEDESAGEGADDFRAGDLESILGLCLAQGMPQRMLRWHYRSRHHSLIAVSNREFYESRLYVVPSPTTVTAAHGLHFRPVEGGVFDRGGTATNRVEARAVAKAVVEHARRFPKQSSASAPFRSPSATRSATSWKACSASMSTSPRSSRPVGPSPSSSRIWRTSRETSAT